MIPGAINPLVRLTSEAAMPLSPQAPIGKHSQKYYMY